MSRTALICDDDPVVRGVVAEMVQAHGWEPAETATARGALLLTELLGPDLVIMDVALAGMSGLEASARIRTECPTARILVLSSFEVPPETCRRVGAIGAIAKDELPRLESVLDELQPAM